MKKSFILLAVIAYACVAVYSLTRIKSSAPGGTNAQAENSSAKTTNVYKLYSNQPEALMKFYREAFGTGWQAIEGGYQGQVLDATINIIESKAQRRLRRVSLQLRSTELTDIVSRVLDAGGNIKAKSGTSNKNYAVSDPDGNLILISQVTR